MRVKELKYLILKSSDRELKKHLYRLFNNKCISIHEFMNILDTIKKLDDNTLIYGIARMEQIETDYDHSKYVPPLVTLLASMYLIYEQILSIYFVFIIASIIALSIIPIMRSERRLRAAAVYFKSLLVQIKESKKHPIN